VTWTRTTLTIDNLLLITTLSLTIEYLLLIHYFVSRAEPRAIFFLAPEARAISLHLTLLLLRLTLLYCYYEERAILSYYSTATTINFTLLLLRGTRYILSYYSTAPRSNLLPRGAGSRTCSCRAWTRSTRPRALTCNRSWARTARRSSCSTCSRCWLLLFITVHLEFLTIYFYSPPRPAQGASIVINNIYASIVNPNAVALNRKP